MRALWRTRLDIWFFFGIVGAVVFGNGVSFYFFLAAMKASKLQKDGAKDNELPLWVYPGLIAGPALVALVASGLG